MASQIKVCQKYIYSVGGGIAIAYVFIDLLPKLCSSNELVTKSIKAYIPYIEKHVYIMALLGFTLFYLVDKSKEFSVGANLSIASYSLFNFLVGYAVADPFNPRSSSPHLFSIALGLHLFVNDNTLREKLGVDYQKRERWILTAMLLLGWIIGSITELPSSAIALVSSFIGGGVIMNVIRNELPSEKPNSTPLFIFSILLYSIILLSIGGK